MLAAVLDAVTRQILVSMVKLRRDIKTGRNVSVQSTGACIVPTLAAMVKTLETVCEV